MPSHDGIPPWSLDEGIDPKVIALRSKLSTKERNILRTIVQRGYNAFFTGKHAHQNEKFLKMERLGYLTRSRNQNGKLIFVPTEFSYNEFRRK